MPCLISQLVMKPVLYTMAALNFLLLGACACLLLPAAGSHLAASIFPGFSSSSQPRANADAAAQARSLTAAPATAAVKQPGAPSDAAPAYATSADSKGVIIAASASGVPAPFLDREQFAAARAVESAAAAQFAAPSAAQPASAAAQPVREFSGGPVESRVVSINSAAAAADSPAPAAVPVAFTTSDEGATPAQAAALGRLQKDFAGTVNSSPNQNPNSAVYAQTWQAAQAASDANFAQQFGWQAFVQAQLAQAHGGVGN